MADTRGAATVGWNDRCGCPVPCPGGVTCRCTSTGGSAEGAHSTCPCGEHCGCNPCTCRKSVATAGVGKAYCKCGDGCTCEKCSS